MRCTNVNASPEDRVTGDNQHSWCQQRSDPLTIDGHLLDAWRVCVPLAIRFHKNRKLDIFGYDFNFRTFSKWQLAFDSEHAFTFFVCACVECLCTSLPRRSGDLTDPLPSVNKTTVISQFRCHWQLNWERDVLFSKFLWNGLDQRFMDRTLIIVESD